MYYGGRFHQTMQPCAKMVFFSCFQTRLRGVLLFLFKGIFMFRSLKWIFIIVFSLFLFVFLFMWFISQGIDSSLENDYISNDESIQKLQQKHIETIRQINKEVKEKFSIKVPDVVAVNKTATYQYTKPRKSTISNEDKACNSAIFQAMNDKSKESQENKKLLCSHNLN